MCCIDGTIQTITGSEEEALNKNINGVDWCSDSCGIKEKRKHVRVSERDEESGSSQSREAAHTNHRELSQEPLAHTGGTQAGQQAVPGTNQKEQRVRGIRLLQQAVRENSISIRQAEVPGSQRKQTVGESTLRGRTIRQQAIKQKAVKEQAVRKQVVGVVLRGCFSSETELCSKITLFEKPVNHRLLVCTDCSLKMSCVSAFSPFSFNADGYRQK